MTDSSQPSTAESNARRASVPVMGATRVILVTTVLLSFISFWRAAAIVLSDLASTAYYIGGIAEYNIGKAAPWFILFVMLFAYAVRSVYMESCSMFVRGGVYRIVKEAMGSGMAKVAVSALVFDFVLTGPISSVSAGHYLHSFLLSLSHEFHFPFMENGKLFAVAVALLMTFYFWRLNLRGVEESSDRALKIFILTAVMVVILDIWCVQTVAVRGGSLPPFELVPRDSLRPHSLGWLEGVPWIKSIGLAVFFVALGHTLLAMSGEEALAQVYREIEAPKQKNLKKAAFVIFLMSIFFTAFVSFAAYAIVPEAQRLAAGDNLLNALVLNLTGPHWLKLIMVAFVVLVGALILAGAVNTSIFASNGVLNRVAEDGILADWFRVPHPRFGTTYRIIHLVAILQVITILASMGDIHILGEAYAFGVIWSFAFMSVSMLILRYKYKGERTIRVPLNIHLGKLRLPLGIAFVCAILVGVAMTNLFTKKIATVSGVAFTGAFFAMFTISDHYNRRKRKGAPADPHTEKFFLDHRSDIMPQDLPLLERDNDATVLLVPIRDPNNLAHLKLALQRSHEEKTEIVVMTVKVDSTYRQHAEQHSRDESARLVNEKGSGSLDESEEVLFTRVVELAENYGEQIVPMLVPSNNAWYAIAKTAHDIGADEILLGWSGRVAGDVQLQQLAMMLALVREPGDKETKLRIISRDGKELTGAV